MDDQIEYSEDFIKKSINITTSFLDRKVFLNFTWKQLITLIVFSILNLVISIIILVFSNIIIGVIFCGILIVLTICFLLKNCLLLSLVKNFFKWLFTSKRKQTNQFELDSSFIQINNKKILIYEIITNPLLGSEFMILSKIKNVVKMLSILENFSIMSSELNYDNLTNNDIYIDNKINEYIDNNDNVLNNPILNNLLANKFLINNYASGAFAKRTFLLICEFNNNTSIDSIFNSIRTINFELQNFNFKCRLLKKETINFLAKNLFNFGQKFITTPYCIKINENYSHYIKVNSLPSFLEAGYLNFLENISISEDVKLDYCINTYKFSSTKKEEKVWENAIKYFEYLFKKATKAKEIEKAENDIEAIRQMTKDLLDNKTSPVKFEIIFKLTCSNFKKLKRQVRDFKKQLEKVQQFELNSSLFLQFDLFNSFQRNLNLKNPEKKNYLILPNDLICWSYPFFAGNSFFNNGLFLGQMENGNPVFMSLNKGEKTNNSSLVIGKTGSGKSEFLKFITKNNCSEQNIITILLDPKGEYSLDENIIKLNPQLVDFEKTNKICLNPFELCKNDSLEDQVNYLVEFLYSFFDPKDWNTNIKHLLIMICNKCFKRTNKPRFSLLYKYILELKYQLTPDDIDFKNIDLIEKVLLSLNNGIYSYFSKSIDFEIKSNLVIFNLSALLTNNNQINKIKLKLLISFIKKFIYNQSNLQNNNKKIQLIVDEFPVLANPNLPFVSTEFVSMIRLVRSYDASLVLAMQDVDTLKSRDSGTLEQIKAIANNTRHIFIFNLNSDQLAEIKNLWGDAIELSKNEILKISTEFKPGDILYISNSERFYFNSTDPTKPYSYLYEPINEFIENFNNNVKEQEENICLLELENNQQETKTNE